MLKKHLISTNLFWRRICQHCRFKDSPEAVRTEDANKLMYISLPIGKGNILMATVPWTIGNSYKPGNNFALF